MSLVEADLCIVGAGAAGLLAAAAASQLGARTVLVERAAMGGERFDAGGLAARALAAAAAAAVAHRQFPAFGLQGAAPAVDVGDVLASARAVLEAVAPNDGEARYRALGVTLLRAEGRFIDPRRLAAGDSEVRARRFLLATGSRPLLPPLPGLAEARPLTGHSLFELREPPKHLAVLGGGAFGTEIAQAFARLGCRVTLIEAGRLLPGEDPELAGAVERGLRADGVELRLGRRVLSLGAGPMVHLDGGETIAASHLLVALGRQPDYEGLALELAGVELREGRLVLDRCLRTTNRRIYAAGDAAGEAQPAHLASAQAGLVLRGALFGLPARADRLAAPRAVFADPELAWVGLSEEEAAARGPVRVLRWSFHENDAAQAARATAGQVKLLVTPRGRVLGAGIVGRHAAELIQPWALAVAGRVRLGDLGQALVPYPTLAEAGKRAAGSVQTARLFRPAVRKLVRLLARLP